VQGVKYCICFVISVKQIAKAGESVNGQDKRRYHAAVDSLTCLCWWIIKGKSLKVAFPHLNSEKSILVID
jgi:hypothetical protein